MPEPLELDQLREDGDGEGEALPNALSELGAHTSLAADVDAVLEDPNSELLRLLQAGSYEDLIGMLKVQYALDLGDERVLPKLFPAILAGTLPMDWPTQMVLASNFLAPVLANSGSLALHGANARFKELMGNLQALGVSYSALCEPSKGIIDEFLAKHIKAGFEIDFSGLLPVITGYTDPEKKV